MGSLYLPSLDQSSTYEFLVIAKGDAETYADSDASSTKTWTTKTKLATPTVTTTKDANSITATWSTIQHATSYTVEYKLSTASTWTTSTTSSLSKTIENLTSGATYKIRVKATSTDASYVDSDYSTEATVVVSTQLDTPSPTYSSTTNSISATWSKDSNASSYWVFYKKSYDVQYSAEQVSQPSGSTVTWSKSSLVSGTVYSVYVQAVGSGNYTDSATSTPTNVTVKTKLAAPTGLAITRTTNSLTLSWGAVANASGYAVYYKTGTGSYQSQNVSSGTSFPLTGLNEGVSYTFYVVAKGSGNYVDSDNSATATGATKITLNTPTGLAATNVLSTTATLSWNTVTNAASYLLTISDSNGAITGYNNKSVSGTSINLTGLTATHEYTVSVIATSGSDDYVNSAAATLVFTTDTKLGTPAAPTLKSKTISSLTVQWNAVSAADSYTLAYKLSTASSFTEVPNLTSREYMLPSLDQGATYTFKVRAITTNDAYESGEYSSEASFTTLIKLPVPDGLNVTGIDLTEATLNWNDVLHSSGYLVKYRKEGDQTWTEVPVEG